jgi:hypothetical protein
MITWITHAQFPPSIATLRSEANVLLNTLTNSETFGLVWVTIQTAIGGLREIPTLLIRATKSQGFQGLEILNKAINRDSQ